MSTLVTGNVHDITGRPDNSPWVFWSLVLRDSPTGSVVTTKRRAVSPAAGALVVELEPGFCTVEYNGNTYYVTVPDVAEYDLWDLIQAAVAVPPGTTTEMLAAVVEEYLAANPPVFSTAWSAITSKPAVIAAGADQATARAAISAEGTGNKNQANGYAGLDGTGKVAAAQLPSYVDDVVEYSTTVGFPVTGESGKLYVTTSNNKQYRWTGSVYVEIVSSPGSSDSVTEGSTNLYYTTARAALKANLASPTFTGTVSGVTKAMVGLGNVDNTSNATERAAAAALTNKDLTSGTNTFPTFNQSTTGSAATLTTGRTVQINLASTSSQSFNGSANITPGVTGTLAVGNGGTGAVTLTGVLKGNGTGAFTAATAGTDFVSPGGALGTPSSGTLTNCSGLPVSGLAASTATAVGVGSIELGHATDTTLTRSAAGKLAVEGVDVVLLSGAQTLTGKTLTSPVVNSPTGIVKADVGLGNVDNTSNATERAAAATLTNKTLTNPTINNYTEGVVAIGTVTTTNTLSLTNGTVQTATLTASTACTFTMPSAAAGKSFTLMLKQAATTGGGSATFGSVKWPMAGAPTITSTAAKMDILSFFSDGTNWYGSYSQGYTP